MNKKLTAKVQKITTTPPSTSSFFSDILIIEPDNDLLLKKKGTIYVVFNIAGPDAFDTSMVTKVIHDVLHDSYYQSDNISPIQSLERAIVDVKEKVTNLYGDVTKEKSAMVSFNVLAAALWGNVLYTVHHGRGESFIMREGNIKPISSITEGNFSAASGVVKNDDVIILGTQPFIDRYPPEKLLSTGQFTLDTLPPGASCLMLKFVVEAAFSEDEYIDFGIGSKKTLGIKKIAKNLKNKLSKPKKEKKQEEVKEEEKETITSLPKLKPYSQLKLKQKTRFKWPTIIILIAAILLGISILYTLKFGKPKQKDNEEPQNLGINTSISNSEDTDEDVFEEIIQDKSIKTIDPEIFYDIKISDENANPTDIVLFTNSVVVTDKASGAIYVSKLDTPKFSPEKVQFPGINFLVATEGKLNFKDNEGYKVYDISNSEVLESYELKGAGVTHTYLDFIYETKNDTLVKYTKDGDSLQESLWAQNKDFENARTMDIAISIYLLTQDNELVRYTQGVKDSFGIRGLEKKLIDPIQIVTGVEFENIYIADRGGNRVIVMDKEGNLIKQYKHVKDAFWNDINGISISYDESKLFVLSGSRVFEIEL